MNINEKEIQTILGEYLFSKHYSPIVTNFTGHGLSECDLLAISKSDLIYEYEIKTTISDFKADQKKITKHQNLKHKITGTYKDWTTIPNYFYYTTPKEISNTIKELLPNYAGLISIDKNKNIETIKKAPKLHNLKASPSLIKKISKNLTEKSLFGCSYMHYKYKLRKLQISNSQTHS